MSEITKLYENAGIKSEWRYTVHQFCHFYEADKEDILRNKYLFKERKTARIKKAEKKYPPFTAEKQIAILMFILSKFGDIGFQKMYSIRGNDESTRKDFIKCLCDCEHETLDSRPVDFYYQNGASGDNFEESLAGLINNLWQNFTADEKQQVKGILE